MSALDDMRAHLRAIRTLTKGIVSGIPDLAEEGDPIELFGRWYADAEASGLLLPESMALATSTADGRPSVRMVLLKGFDASGFRFFTNYDSRKAGELEDNPRGALCFHWSVLERQVRVEGPVQRLTPEESDAYFQTRPRGSRIGAWASAQSRPLGDRAELEARVAEIEARFADAVIPCPPSWGGYRLAPERIEFWQGRADRLHDRLLFVADGDGWNVGRLQP